MSNFDIRKFLTENKLTVASRLQEENTPGFDQFADAVEDLIPLDDPRHDQLLDAVHQALVDGDLTLPGHGGESYSKQVYDIAKMLGLIEEEVQESSDRDDRMQGLVNIKAYNAFIKASRLLVQDLKNEGFDEEDIHSFLLKGIKSQKYIAENSNTSVKLSKIILEQQGVRSILKELDSYAAEFEDKLYTYSDKELVDVKNKLERLLPSSATDSETLLQNIADFIDDILGVGDIMPYPFDTLEKLHDLELFDFYSEFENIVRRLIEHIEGNVMYDRSHQASGVD